MKMVCKKLILISVFLNIFCILACGINSQVVYAAPNSINETMSKEETMNKYYELKKDNQELIEKYDKLNGEWSSKKHSIDYEVDKTNNRLDKIYICAGVIVLLLSVLLRMSLREIRKCINDKVKSVVENEVNDKVPNEVKDKVGIEVDRLKKIVDDCKKEEKLMKEKNILVISKEYEDKKDVEDVMVRFIGAKYEEVVNINDLEKYDAIIFNNRNNKISHEEIIEIIDKSCMDDKKVYLYFGGRLEQKSTQNINYASSKITLYNNLMNLLKFQDDILLKSENGNCCL